MMRTNSEFIVLYGDLQATNSISFRGDERCSCIIPKMGGSLHIRHMLVWGVGEIIDYEGWEAFGDG